MEGPDGDQMVAYDLISSSLATAEPLSAWTNLLKQLPPLCMSQQKLLNQ